jgi:small redox-active disulfide protein 2
MEIKILGTGCPNCIRLEANVKIALEKAWIEANVEKITEIDKIMAYWVMWTPWLVIDEKVISVGKVISVEDITEILNWKIIKQDDSTKKSCWCSFKSNC